MKSVVKVILFMVLIGLFPILGVVLLILCLLGTDSSLYCIFIKGLKVIKYVGISMFCVFLLILSFGLNNMTEVKKEAQTEVVPYVNSNPPEESTPFVASHNSFSEGEAILYEEGDYGLLGNDEIEIEYNLKKNGVIDKESRLRNNTYYSGVVRSNEHRNTSASARIGSSTRIACSSYVARGSSSVRGK